MSKSSHATAKYQWSPKGGERCAVCTMFRPPADCSSVESPISPEGWCSYFASRAAAMNKAARETDQHPSEAQKKAGNYRKGSFDWMGACITIENPLGSIRRGVGKDGKPWECKQPAHYGYINATEAVDGDHVDVYIGHAPASQRVWVIDQIDPETKRYDEPKCMLSFPSKDVALATYRRAFTDGKNRVGGVTEMTIPHFMKWKDTQAKHKRKNYAAGGGVQLAMNTTPVPQMPDAHSKEELDNPVMPPGAPWAKDPSWIPEQSQEHDMYRHLSPEGRDKVHRWFDFLRQQRERRPEHYTTGGMTMPPSLRYEDYPDEVKNKIGADFPPPPPPNPGENREGYSDWLRQLSPQQFDELLERQYGPNGTTPDQRFLDLMRRPLPPGVPRIPPHTPSPDEYRGH